MRKSKELKKKGYQRAGDQMQQESPSVPATTPRSQSGSIDYYYRFKEFRSFYPIREYHLASSIFDAMGPAVAAAGRSLSILDVGSGDGDLLAELVGLLRNASSAIGSTECLAVEPDSPAFDRLQVTSRLLSRTSGIIVDCSPDRIESLLHNEKFVSKAAFDLILCSHVFYHFEDGLAIVRRLQNILTQEGKIVVILDSHESPIYRFRDDLYPEIVAGGGGSMTDQYGALVSAEGFQKSLVSASIPHEYRELEWALVLPSKMIMAHLTDVMAFLYRVPIEASTGVVRAMRPFAMKFRCNGVYAFPWKEGLFLIGR